MPFASLKEKQAYQRTHYAKNRKRYLQRKKRCRAAHYERNKRVLIEAKKGGCVDCTK
jgi:hypothetical protein